MRPFKALIVEDFADFRRFLHLTLQENAECQIIGEASDGLQPDLILLDIGLPALNGIEVARRIRKLSPNSKILFVTQESSVEAIQEAFRLGACGYLLKLDAAELLLAVDAVLQGTRFVSSHLKHHRSPIESSELPMF